MVQLTPDEQKFFSDIGRFPVFRAWLDKELRAPMDVLKGNTKLEQICQAQGAVRVLETIKSYAGLSDR